VAAALLVTPGIIGWLGQLGGGAGVGVGSPSPAAATPGSSAVATPGATATPAATPFPTVGPSATPGPTPAATPQIYVVVKGDRLGIIARRFGVSLAALEKANGLNDQSLIKIGQKLIIPPK
jgi:LysM repeat protein